MRGVAGGQSHGSEAAAVTAAGSEQGERGAVGGCRAEVGHDECAAVVQRATGQREVVRVRADICAVDLHQGRAVERRAVAQRQRADGSAGGEGAIDGHSAVDATGATERRAAVNRHGTTAAERAVHQQRAGADGGRAAVSIRAGERQRAAASLGERGAAQGAAQTDVARRARSIRRLNRAATQCHRQRGRPVSHRAQRAAVKSDCRSDIRGNLDDAAAAHIERTPGQVEHSGVGHRSVAQSDFSDRGRAGAHEQQRVARKRPAHGDAGRGVIDRQCATVDVQS